MATTTSKNLENPEKARWGYLRSNTTKLLVRFNLTFGVVIPLFRTSSEYAFFICMTNTG